MSEQFDAYHEWLGIPASEQPPNHYRLLAIPTFEQSPTVIENAADQRMAHLRTFQLGGQSALSQKLLNEVAAARVCLLNPAKKAAYDTQLREKLQPAEHQPLGLKVASPIADTESDGETAFPAFTPSPTPTHRPAAKKQKPGVDPRVVVGGGAALLVVLGLVAWAVTRSGPPPTTAQPNRPAASRPVLAEKKTVVPVPPPPPKIPLSESKPASAPVDAAQEPAKEQPGPKPDGLAGPTSVPVPPTPDTAAAAGPPLTVAAVHPADPVSEPQRLPIPADAAREQALKLAQEVYKDEYDRAKTPSEKQALARKILATGRKTKDDAVGRFVLFGLARDIAAMAGSSDLAFAAIDEMAASFDVDALEARADVLTKLFKAARTADERKAVIEQARKLMEQAAAEEKFDLAERIGIETLAEARKNHDNELVKSVISLGKSIREQGSAVTQFRKADATLKQTPDDAEANLAVGRYLCVTKGDWSQGLPHLAKGSDASLKARALQETAPPPDTAAEQVNLADAWWDMGEEAEGQTREAILLHAGTWYQQAQSNLSEGLLKAKVEKRLAEIAALGRVIPQPPGKQPSLAVGPFDEKTAKQHQVRWAKYLGVPAVLTNSIGMRMVLIPPGEFQMGSLKELVEQELEAHADDKWYKDRVPAEGPEHQVRITQPFYLGATEVTQADYTRLMGSTISRFQGDPKNPVERVSWDDAMEFCRRLSELPMERTTKRQYTLPTEAQREFACRAGTATRYFFGDDANKLGEYAWFRVNSRSQTHPVGQKRPNAWGLYDMYGNVWEWCQDWHQSDYYSKSPTYDPSGPSIASTRVIRGGGWQEPGEKCRSAFRIGLSPGTRRDVLGFRLCLALADKVVGRPTQSVPAAVASPPSSAPLPPAPTSAGPRPPLAVAPFSADEARKHQEMWANHLGVPVVQSNSIGMKLVLIPPGEFQMGSPKELIDEELRAHGDDKWYKERLPGEGPQHRVRLTKPYWLGVTEVTQEEYQRVMGSNPSKYQGDQKRPVEQVSWDDTAEFCRRLSELPGEKAARRRYALPTEAQWEYASRAGSEGPRSYSPDPGALVAGEGERLLSVYGWSKENAGGQTHPVAQKRPNVWGLYDMYGNVREWCQDWYDGGCYAKSPADDPAGPPGGAARVLRGGGWVHPAMYCRSACRSYAGPRNHSCDLGLRVCLALTDTVDERPTPQHGPGSGLSPAPSVRLKASREAKKTWVSRDATYTASSMSHSSEPALPSLLTDVGKRHHHDEFAFQTKGEQAPYITITLSHVCTIHSFYVQNRTYPPLLRRAAGLTMWVSMDGKEWEHVWTAKEVKQEWNEELPQPAIAKYVRLSLAGDSRQLHLRTVKLFGVRSSKER